MKIASVQRVPESEVTEKQKSLMDTLNRQSKAKAERTQKKIDALFVGVPPCQHVS